MGGEDEIDEKLGVTKQEQDKAFKNKKSADLGYKGVKNSEKVPVGTLPICLCRESIQTYN